MLRKLFVFQVIDDFVKSVKETDITIISQEIFQHDPATRVENLKVRCYALFYYLITFSKWG